MRRSVFVLAVGVVLGAAGPALAQLAAGPEFRVNTFTPDEQKRPAVAVQPSGDFVIVWSSRYQDGSGFGVFGRRYNALGQPVTGEFQVNTATTNFQYNYGGGVAADRSGNFMVVWTSSAPGQDGSGRGIMGRIYNPAGVPMTAEFPVNAFVAGAQNRAAVASLPGAQWVVVWDSAGPDGSAEAIVGRKFDSAGRPLTGEFPINTFAPNRQIQPRVAADAAGNFVVVWQSYNQDGSRWGVIGRRFNSAAAPLAGEFAISTVAYGDQRYPRVSTVPDGRFAVVWDDQPRDGHADRRFGIFGRRYDAFGNPFGAEIQLNVYTTDHQREPTVAAFGDGSFIASWFSQDQFGPAKSDVMARMVDAAGAPGPEIRVNQDPNPVLDQFLAAADADETGNIVIAWDSIGQDGSLDSIYARRFGGLVASAMDVDAAAVPGSSNGNQVFEPNETVNVRPSWRNVQGGAVAFDGAATFLAGPAGAVYSVVDGSASYGAVPNNTVGQCGAGGANGCYVLRVQAAARPFQHWDATFRETLVPPLVHQSKAWHLHIGNSYADVPPSNPYYRFAETVLHRGVIGPCSTTQYCPSVIVTRDRMAQYVLKAKDPYWVPTACIAGTEMFADVPASSPFCPWVEELVRRGVVAGCGGGNYCPAAGVSREQLAVFVLKTLEGIAYVPPACGTPVFNDVPASSPFCRYVEELARRGVVTGCGGGAYCPLVQIPRDQMSVFLSVTFGLTLYGP
jgi:hypothetical protein